MAQMSSRGTQLFCSLFIVIGLVAVGIGIWMFSKSLRAEHWPVTDGIVQSAEMKSHSGNHGGTTYAAEVTYSYQVAGTSYTGDKVSVGQMSSSSEYARGILNRYAVFEGKEKLVECDTKTARGDNKNAQTLNKVENLIAHFQPDVVILENTSVKCSRRSQRIRTLNQQIIKLARDGKVKVKLISRERTMKTFFPAGDGTRHAMAEAIAKMFSEQLKAQLPPKRKPWDSENHRMAMFDAVALTLVFRKNAE